MTSPATLAALILPLRERWRALPAGQQRVGVVAGILGVMLLAFAFIWLPVMREHDRLVARLPQLQAQLKTMQTQAEVLRRINMSPPTAANAGAALDAAALQAVFGSAARISAAPDRAFRVSLARIPYAQVWDRLGEAMGRHGLQLKTLNLQPNADAGPAHEVTVDMLLVERSGGGR
jgi:type II secretory pathway component PulM